MPNVKDPKSGQVLMVADTAPYLAQGWTATNEPSTTNQEDPNAQAYAIIDADPNLTPEQKALAKATVGAYSGGIEADAPAILRTFETLKQTTIDPHFNDLIKQATYGLQKNVANLQAQRQAELEAQGINAAEAVRGAQGSLEASGLLNTGEAIRQLGTAGAPAIPFGGAQPIEGLVPQRNRLIATASEQKQNEDLRGQYNLAEQALGTTGVGGLIPPDQTIGGVTGTIPTTRTKQYGTTLADVAASVEAKRGLTAAKPNPVAPIAIK